MRVKIKQRAILAAALLVLTPATARAADPMKPMNVVLILADDLGWADVACQGADLHETPHIDRLGARLARYFPPDPEQAGERKPMP